MMFPEKNQNENEFNLKVKVIGLGGAGNNLVNTLAAEPIPNVECLNVNTDVQVLRRSSFRTIQIGVETCRGRGAGANPNIGRKAAMENLEALEAELEGLDLLYLVAGLGGGTGTGSISVMAELAKKKHILTIAIVTMPFSFEQQTRAEIAEQGLRDLVATGIDSYIVVQNDRCGQDSYENTRVQFNKSLCSPETVLREAISGLMSAIVSYGDINVDFADVETILRNGGKTRIGVGRGTSLRTRAYDALVEAVNSPLIDGTIAGAQNIMLVCRSSNITTAEIRTINRMLIENAQQYVKRKIQFIFGNVTAPDMGDEIELILIATNFETPEEIGKRIMPAPEVAATNNPSAYNAPQEPIISPQTTAPVNSPFGNAQSFRPTEPAPLDNPVTQTHLFNDFPDYSEPTDVTDTPRPVAANADTPFGAPANPVAANPPLFEDDFPAPQLPVQNEPEQPVTPVQQSDIANVYIPNEPSDNPTVTETPTKSPVKTEPPVRDPGKPTFGLKGFPSKKTPGSPNTDSKNATDSNPIVNKKPKSLFGKKN